MIMRLYSSPMVQVYHVYCVLIQSSSQNLINKKISSVSNAMKNWTIGKFFDVAAGLSFESCKSLFVRQSLCLLAHSYTVGHQSRAPPHNLDSGSILQCIFEQNNAVAWDNFAFHTGLVTKAITCWSRQNRLIWFYSIVLPAKDCLFAIFWLP